MRREKSKKSGLSLAGGVWWGELLLPTSLAQLLSPTVYREIQPTTIPRVDCNHCRLVEEGLSSQEVRCCDIIPGLANFLVGQVLAFGGNEAIEGWIDTKRGDPFALHIPPGAAEQYLNARDGRRRGLPCPLLVPKSGLCSIYAMRPPVCIGYHCYYPDSFWVEAWYCLTSLLEMLGTTASHYLVWNSEMKLKAMAEVWRDVEEEEELWRGEEQDEKAYAAFWQEWEGHERDFYRRCFDEVMSGGAKLRREVRWFQRARLLDHLVDSGKATPEREDELMEEEQRARGAGYPPLAPPESLRQRYRKGYLSLEQNPLTVWEQERVLFWYFQQLP